jgi:simple sugar transport system ATP-binding protein
MLTQTFEPGTDGPAQTNSNNSGAPLIELLDVTVDFGSLRALDHVNLHVNAGEVVGLLGDNGAGKSTLLKIMTGYYHPTSGKVRVFGKDTKLASPAVARQLGIEPVYQDLALIDELSIWRNFFLGEELLRQFGPLRLMRRRKMAEVAKSELEAIGIRRVHSASQRVLGLSGGERQSLAIIRAVYFGAKLLLLDEPTAALSVRETARVFAAVRAAQASGHGVLYIDHNISHTYSVVDRVVLIERGRVAGEMRREDTSVEELVRILGAPPEAEHQEHQNGTPQGGAA